MENIKISVYCLSYNCIQFIEKSINGMLNQKINVNYKIIIHDDSSSDGSSEIIKKYAAMYPDKIYAILQSENQYSKGINIYKEYIAPNIEGKYIAICEGDDYWMDESKLQIQYDYMEAHPECSLCTHNTRIYDLKTGKTQNFNDWNEIHVLTQEDVFWQWKVHTSSYFIKRSNMDWNGNEYWCGDYMILTWAFFKGSVVSIPRLMSVYNLNNPMGVTVNMFNSGIKEKNKRERERIKYLHEFNVKTNFKYDEIISKRCKFIDYYCLERECDYIIYNSKSKQMTISAAQQMTAHEYYNDYINSKCRILRLMRRYRYEGYIFYSFWKLVMKKYLKNRL